MADGAGLAGFADDLGKVFALVALAAVSAADAEFTIRAVCTADAVHAVDASCAVGAVEASDTVDAAILVERLGTLVCFFLGREAVGTVSFVRVL